MSDDQLPVAGDALDQQYKFTEFLNRKGKAIISQNLRDLGWPVGATQMETEVHLNGIPFTAVPDEDDTVLNIMHLQVVHKWYELDDPTKVRLTIPSYVHFLFKASASPPYRIKSVQSGEVPLISSQSHAPWFSACRYSDVHVWSNATMPNDSPCAPYVAFVGGLELIPAVDARGSLLMISYGTGDVTAARLELDPSFPPSRQTACRRADLVSEGN